LKNITVLASGSLRLIRPLKAPSPGGTLTPKRWVVFGGMSNGLEAMPA
jgi:hypothetical protein